MLQLVKKIGHNFGILDTDDWSFEWVHLEELKGYVKQGVVIEGVASDASEFTPKVAVLAPEQCNFAHGKNVFTAARGYIVGKTSWKFTINVDNRKYRGILEYRHDQKSVMHFNCGVDVLLGESDFKVLTQGDGKEALDLLHSLGNGLTPRSVEHT